MSRDILADKTFRSMADSAKALADQTQASVEGAIILVTTKDELKSTWENQWSISLTIRRDSTELDTIRARGSDLPPNGFDVPRTEAIK